VANLLSGAKMPANRRAINRRSGETSMSSRTYFRWVALSVLFLCRGHSASSETRHKEPENLIANGDFSAGSIGGLPEGWSVVTANPVLKPVFKLVTGANGGRELMAQGNGRRECYGYARHFVQLESGKNYRLRVRFHFTGLEDVNRNLVHMVNSRGFNDGIFKYRKQGEWVIGEERFQTPADAASLAGAEIRLYFRYSASGTAWWGDVSLQECEPEPPRIVKIATAWGEGDNKHWEAWADAAGRKRADIALLPEMFDGNHDPMKAESVEGPTWRFMAGKARQWKMYVTGTFYLKRGDIIYNSAPLFDREGKLVGIYDKNMLYEPELDAGATPGTGFPVFNTDFGKVGIEICYDGWFPEVTRLLALKGAELVLLPNAAYYTDLIHARSADNTVVVAVSSLGSPAGVWDTGGNLAGEIAPNATRSAPSGILAVEKDQALGLLLASVDLSKKTSPHFWGGPMRSSPGGRRVRKTWITDMDPEIVVEGRRWAERDEQSNR
jgi:predicted amidohydrolase